MVSGICRIYFGFNQQYGDPGVRRICLIRKYCSVKFSVITFALALVSCGPQVPQSLVTIADARSSPAQYIDTGIAGDSVGDILVFDQPLLDNNKQTIGTNSGTCIRTRIAHSFQCQWTLTFASKTASTGSIQVAGREYDHGISTISIIGGTGIYSGISGEMQSSKNNDGSFTQRLRYTIKQ